jgi:hypothetical protein
MKIKAIIKELLETKAAMASLKKVEDQLKDQTLQHFGWSELKKLNASQFEDFTTLEEEVDGTRVCLQRGRGLSVDKEALLLELEKVGLKEKQIQAIFDATMKESYWTALVLRETKEKTK